MGIEKADLVEGFTVALKEIARFPTHKTDATERAINRIRQHDEVEQVRVSALVRQMGEYERSERALKQAQIAFGNGNTACLDETVIAPTPEQLAKGTFERFTADTLEGTARSATTVRRKIMSHVQKYYETGLIELEALIACRWYRDLYEATGLTGNIPSTDYGKDMFSQPHSRSMFSDWQIDMQDMFRAARAEMTPRYLPFFDAIVLHEQSPRAAIELAKKRNGTEKALFRDVVSELVAAYDMLKS
jgi:hypothetical protein